MGLDSIQRKPPYVREDKQTHETSGKDLIFNRFGLPVNKETSDKIAKVCDDQLTGSSGGSGCSASNMGNFGSYSNT